MDRSFELTYKLRAQSPMLHFQAKQQGATLRATEVKPKLDRFIIKKIGRNNIPSNWIISADALNYKMKFMSEGDNRLSEPAKIYYGNPKDSSSQEYVWALTTNCTMQILCFIPELKKTIEKYIKDFFICTNFGRMQGKGFGSFIIEGEEYKPTEIGKVLCKENEAAYCYSFNKSNNAFDDIQLLYSVMKSGYNRANQYHRSYLFEYFHENGIGNEKAALKKEKVSPAISHPNNNKVFPQDTTEPYYYVRALLGVGDHIDYITGFERRPNRQGVMGTFPLKNKKTIQIKNKEIKRFASPILFKIIGNKIYVVARRIDPDIFGKLFSFENKQTHKSLRLATPDSFDIDAFLAWFVEKYNNDTKDLFGAYSIKQKIETIYTNKGGNANG